MGNKNKYWNLGPIILVNKRSFTGFVLVITIVIFLIAYNANREKSLLIHGKKAYAVVTEIKSVGGKGIIRCYYQFKLNGNNFKGFVDNDNYKTGDTLTVLYKESNPTYNRSFIYITEHYNLNSFN